MKVLEVIGCHSSVVRALVARVPGFDFLATTKIFHIFTLLLLNLIAMLLGKGPGPRD